MLSKQEVLLRLSRFRPTSAGLYIMAATNSAPKCVTILGESPDMWFVDSSGKRIPVKQIPLSTKWSSPIKILPKLE
jgi:hypothetical protein